MKRKPRHTQPQTLGQAIALAREKSGMTQRKLAAECRIGPVYLCRIEKDIAEPSLAILKRIAERLGVDLTIRGKRAENGAKQ